jgi:Rps23 Pro-64 3,4-dihydroxylase Tpa1-like proline 4-hydroxylase
MNSFFVENNYLIIPNFIPIYKVKELSEDFKNYCEQNNVGSDPQVPNSPSCYNYISFLELLCEKTPEVSKILEETVLPTYSYARLYKNGSVLSKHRDRDACEISLTVHLDGDTPWSIWVETPSGEEQSIVLNPGDAMLYSGCTSTHWRDPYEGEEYSQVFLHYVRSRGNKNSEYFDKQNKGIGQLPLEKETLTSTNNNIKSPELIVKNVRSTTKLEDFVVTFDKLVPEELCDRIISEYQNDPLWTPTRVGYGEIDQQIRNCNVLPISSNNLIEKNIDIRKKIDEDMYLCASEVINRYRELFPEIVSDTDTGYELLRYDEGQFYVQHTDSFRQQQRSVTCSFHLNDDYDGGEFAFFDREIIIKSGKGDAIIFPSNFMFPHEIMPVLSGTRYSIITWYV